MTAALALRWRDLPALTSDSILVEVCWYDDCAPDAPGSIALRFGGTLSHYVEHVSTLLVDNPERGIRASFRVIDGKCPDVDTLAELGSDVRLWLEDRRVDRPRYRMSLTEVCERVQAAALALSRQLGQDDDMGACVPGLASEGGGRS